MRTFLAIILVSLPGLIFSCNKSGDKPGKRQITDTDHLLKENPEGRLVEIPIDRVELTEGFWKERFDLVKEVTIPKMYEYMHADSSSHWRNFLIAVGEAEGEFFGTSWHDGDFYKLLEAMVNVYQVTHDPELDKLMDYVIDIIARAQEPDGYISMFIQLQNRERWFTKMEHELYNFGHLMTVSARHYEATGKTNLLDVGIKAADYLYQTFAVDRASRLNYFGFNPSNIMGAMDLFRVTRNHNYLALADTFVTMRGTSRLNSNITVEEFMRHRHHPPGEDQNQDRLPFRQENEAVGHSVTATYLYAGAADLYMETGEQALLDANRRIWEDVVTRKLGIHGGTGPIPFGLSIRRDRVSEAFAEAYNLPLRVSYNETCANIGNIMWNWRMHKTSPDVKYLEIMEKGMYNSGLSGLGLDGFSFYYNNPLRRFSENVPLSGGAHEIDQRSHHIRVYCCPPQLARHIAGIRKYMYSVSLDKPEIWINLFSSSRVNATLNDGTPVGLTQDTKYPWEGDIEITVELQASKRFSINIPVPSWATGAEIKLNGKKITGVQPGKFLSLEREWKNNDLINISLPMRVRVMKANPLVEQTLNQVAVMRGPLVYCLESTDLPQGVNILDVVLKRGAKYHTEFKPGLLGGVSVIRTKALAVTNEEWSSKPYNSPELYKEIGDETIKEIEIQLVPYYSWSNRGISDMTIWLPFRH